MTTNVWLALRQVILDEVFEVEIKWFCVIRMRVLPVLLDTHCPQQSKFALIPEPL